MFAMAVWRRKICCIALEVWRYLSGDMLGLWSYDQLVRSMHPHGCRMITSFALHLTEITARRLGSESRHRYGITWLNEVHWIAERCGQQCVCIAA